MKRAAVLTGAIVFSVAALAGCGSNTASPSASPSASVTSGTPGDPNACAQVNQVMGHAQTYGSREKLTAALEQVASKSSGQTQAMIQQLATAIKSGTGQDAAYQAAVAKFIQVCGKPTPAAS